MIYELSVEIQIAAALILGVLGAFIYRFRGISSTKVPPILYSRTLRRVLSASVIVPGAYLAGAGLWALLAAPIAYYGIIAGHGSYIDLGTGAEPDNEVFDTLLDWIFGLDYIGANNFWRDFTGLALTGLLVTVPVAFLPGINWSYALIGLFKPIAYQLSGNTEKGEIGWGFAYASAIVFA
jgi:hypothetical protein|tara:strand:- start:10417 stop:10956 length:540 start_codon:yes stop_codon:yes gene_type:complete